GQQIQQLALRRALGELPRQRLARIGERVVDELLLLAALRDGDLDLVTALGAQRLGEQRAFLDVAGDEDAARARLVVVELREKGAQHLAGRKRAIGLGEIGAITPVLSGAEEEHLNAIEAPGLMHGEYVGLLDPARIDALRRLHRRERGEAVAIDAGTLELERGGGLLHLCSQLVFDRLALAREERVRFAHELAVFGEIDLARAGAGAALDLVKQAWPRAALKERIRTGAQQKGALQRRDGAVDGPHRRERPVIIAVAGACAAMLEDLLRPMVGGDQDVGKRLVIAQEYIEARTQALDQIGFQQQRLGFRRGRHELERGGRRDHALDAGVVARWPGIGDDTFADVLRFADVEHVA